MAIDSDGGGGGGAKKKRVDEQGGRCEAVDADAIPALPDELRQRILTHLPLKDAVRRGAVARGWRDLWRGRWAHRASVEINLRAHDAPQRELDALAREPHPRRRLDRFSLVAENCKLKSSELRRFIEYTAECRVEDLHVERRKTTVADKLNFHLPLISNMYYKGAQPFRALEVILLHSVSMTPATFTKMSGRRPVTLRSVTFAEYYGNIGVDLVRARSLRSFRYNGSFLDTPFFLAGEAVLSDLYILFRYSVSRSRHAQEFA
ncbi:hypothetical protein SETIT_4G257100v2 [Setaria italica]|uniref:F-box domain-containing protein n=1 Tax=Setaria italica TaxID=4555 RepID=A0A368QYK2_SETIT|nr:hypothetical protein SETIT_4G257100v2 [Setaria italica]